MIEKLAVTFKKYLNEKRYSTYDSINDLGEGPDGIAAKAKKSGISPNARSAPSWRCMENRSPIRHHHNNEGMAGLTIIIVQRRKGNLNHDKDLSINKWHYLRIEMATRIAAGTIIAIQTIVSGIDADSFSSTTSTEIMNRNLWQSFG